MKFSKGKQLKEKIIILSILAAVIGLLWLLKAPCPFRFIFHIPCPGCGMTRAMVSLLKLDIVSAFRYHYAFWSVPLLFLYFFSENGIFKSKPANIVTLSLIGIAFLANWIAGLVPALLSLCV